MGFTISPALRISAAVLISSFAAVPVYLAAIVLAGEWESGGTLFSFLMVAQTLTMGGVAMVGVPVHLLFARFGVRSAWIYAAAGFFLPLAFLVAARPFGGDAAMELEAQAALAGFVGAYIALIFWKLAASSG